MHGWTQTELANATNIAIPTLCAHLAGRRPIRDDHLALYIVPLDNAEKIMLLSAWLQDILPLDAQEIVLNKHSNTVFEEVQSWRPGIRPEHPSMLRFWAEKLAADVELDYIFSAISRKAGWNDA